MDGSIVGQISFCWVCVGRGTLLSSLRMNEHGEIYR